MARTYKKKVINNYFQMKLTFKSDKLSESAWKNFTFQMIVNFTFFFGSCLQQWYNVTSNHNDNHRLPILILTIATCSNCQIKLSGLKTVGIFETDKIPSSISFTFTDDEQKRNKLEIKQKDDRTSATIHFSFHTFEFVSIRVSIIKVVW